MSFFQQSFDLIANLIGSLGYLGIFLLMFLEGATLPVPSEVVLPFVGYLVFEGKFNFWVAIVAATSGGILGTIVDYSVGYFLGRPAILRYGRYVHLNEEHLKVSESWFLRFGDIVVLLAKFVPLFRTLVSFPAGIARMRMSRFIAFTTIGSIMWNVLLVYVGIVAGQNTTKIIQTLSGPYTIAEIIVALVIVGVLYSFLRRNPARIKNV
ncbi:MAG: DedA family protein [Nitrososphaerota archaeon]|nr:DedA family protein [Nitrososphaerota archaeon]